MSKGILRSWRETRRQEGLFLKARSRAEILSERETVEQIDLTLMTAGQAISRYRNTHDPEIRMDQLHEIQLDLEVALAMVDRLLPG